MYLGKRDFVDHVTHVDPIDGVVLVDPEYLKVKNTHVRWQLLLSTCGSCGYSLVIYGYSHGSYDYRRGSYSTQVAAI